jgi:hypothetical protein
MKKLLHRDEKKYLIPALYATSAVFVNFFVKIFPQSCEIKSFLNFANNQHYYVKEIIVYPVACAVRPACVVLGLLPEEQGRCDVVLQLL